MMQGMQPAQTEIATCQLVRNQCQKLLDRAVAGDSTFFAVAPGQIPATVDFMLEISDSHGFDRNRLPRHSQWIHFSVGEVDRLSELTESILARGTQEDVARAKFELVILSEALDTGGLTEWRFQEPGGDTFSRTEGLALAILYMFKAGTLSSRGADNPYRVDSEKLRAITPSELEYALQVSPSNLLDGGVESRIERLRILADCVGERPGVLFDILRDDANPDLPAGKVLERVLETLSPIWPGAATPGTASVGDVWAHSALSEDGKVVPIHRIAQWLSYALIDPLIEAGVNVTQHDDLTGLAGYRNAGLLIDKGVLNLKDASSSGETYTLSDELIVEWRALTVALIDRVAEELRGKLAQDSTQLPLSCVHGLMWRAGRAIAAELRPGGCPPIAVVNEGCPF